MNGLNFGEALEQLRDGNRVGRAGWNGKGMWLQLVTDARFFDGAPVGLQLEPNGLVSVLEPFIVMYTAQGKWVPWLASQSDVLAWDWMVAP